MKARSLSDPRVEGRPNLGMISIINFLVTIWVISIQVGKASLYLANTVLIKTGKYLYPYDPCLISVKSNSPNSSDTEP